MTREEILSRIMEALNTLKTINPPRSGKSQHRCALCDLSGHHPCPIFAASSALYSAHSVAFGLEPKP